MPPGQPARPPCLDVPASCGRAVSGLPKYRLPAQRAALKLFWYECCGTVDCASARLEENAMTMVRTGRDRQIVDLHDRDMCLYWCEQFSVQPEQLREAVLAVGNRADDIRDYVERHFALPVKWNTAD